MDPVVDVPGDKEGCVGIIQKDRSQLIQHVHLIL
jgi:hypothetical protein